MNITILKGTHETKNDVMKALPYMVACDMFSTENRGCTKERAERTEKEWNETLLHQSRTAVKNRVIELNKGSLFLEFILAQTDMLYRNKKPIWFTERWTSEGAELIVNLHSQFNSYDKIADWYLKHLDLEQYLQNCWTARQYLRDLTLMRDRHIASNLSIAEESIREKHPALREKQELSLAVLIGSAHRVECYAAVPVKTVKLSRTDPAIQRHMDRNDALILDADTIDQARCGMLISVIVALYEQRNRPCDYDLLWTLGEQELKERIIGFAKGEPL